jgi:hypothetical protein
MKLRKRQLDVLTRLCWLKPGNPPGCISSRGGLPAAEKLVELGLARECEPMTRWNREHTCQYTTRRFEATDAGRAFIAKADADAAAEEEQYRAEAAEHEAQLALDEELAREEEQQQREREEEEAEREADEYARREAEEDGYSRYGGPGRW